MVMEMTTMTMVVVMIAMMMGMMVVEVMIMIIMTMVVVMTMVMMTMMMTVMAVIFYGCDGWRHFPNLTTPNAKCIPPQTQHCPAPCRRRLPRSMLILVSGRWAPIVYIPKGYAQESRPYAMLAACPR